MKKNRRNYYRILQVQPDAPLEVVKSNYRTLLQKLKLHPDLGGEDWNASLINQAYNTLKNPKKREKYDKELLQKYDLSKISNGPHKKTKKQYSLARDENGNRRNYYRLLGIQVDAPNEIIKASYDTLSKSHNDIYDRNLLLNAYETLIDAESRKIYNRYLEKEGHAASTDKIKRKDKSFTPQEVKSKLKKLRKENDSVYIPVIKHYCQFCKTPYVEQSNQHFDECRECASPLTPPSEAMRQTTRRALLRMDSDDVVYITLYWPGKLIPAKLIDVSPTGAAIKLAYEINKGHIIKIENNDFKAVAKVTYQKNEFKTYQIGLEFLTINFEKQKGHFLSATA